MVGEYRKLLSEQEARPSAKERVVGAWQFGRAERVSNGCVQGGRVD